MSQSSKTDRSLLWRWGGYFLPSLIALCFLISPLGQTLVWLSFDLLYLFRPAPAPAALNDVVILNMDEDSYNDLDQNPNREWDRAVHARLLRELKVRGAKVVAFDVLFDEPGTDPDADKQLSDAIREHGKVVLAASVQQNKNSGGPQVSRVLRPIDAFSTNAAWGMVESPDREAAAIIREQLHFVEYTNFAWQVAVAYDRAPAQRLVKRWLNYYGPAGTLPTFSYYRALKTNGLPPNRFAGKTVFIGAGGLFTSQGQASDLHATPLSRWGRGQTSGVEIHATAFLNLINKEWLQEFSPVQELFVVLFVGWGFAIGLPRTRPWISAAVALGAAILAAAVAIGLAWGYHLWFPWLIVSAVQIPCALAWTILDYTKRLTQEKGQLEQRVALAESLAGLSARTEASPADSTEPHSTATLEAPPPIPNHRLLRRIGRGAYGEVWIAQDEIGTYHAVKIVYQRSFSNAGPYDREFRGIQKFTPISRQHPGFVHVLHVGRNDPEGYFFYIMELGDDRLTGQQIEPATYSPNSLAAMLEGGRLALPVCVKLGIELTAALQYLHEQKLLHRDIKPSNIIFVNRAPKFADVGLVTNIEPGGKEMTYVGTEGYMPPEGPGTVAADIYSLGKVLYEAGTGRDRLEFPALSSTLIASAREPLMQFNEIVLKACHADISHRYQSALDMQADLDNLSRTMG